MRYLIGIDLGTTNSAVAYVDTQGDQGIRVFEVPQLVAAGEIGARETLPSFLYFAGEGEFAAGELRLPWGGRPGAVVGVLAREQGALVPGRQVASAKSWLCHDAVDRTARILPWGVDHPEQSCSPVEATASYLAHLRDAWNHALAAGREEDRFERQEVVLTVPASFDEEARELTVRAARDAGLERLTLLEEPLAAFYAWIVAHRRALKRHLKDGQLVLVCDVGGGTTDFTLIRVRVVEGEVRFERVAIGEHLLLGGDNVDLALARRVEEKLKSPKLGLRQRHALQRQCCAAKERLLGDGRLGRVPVSVLGSGRAVVGGALSTELTRAEVEETLEQGFLPLTVPGDLPARERRAALRELGLPYATEPAITKHLAAFLHQSLESLESPDGPGGPGRGMVRPDAILFNGGFFTPEVARERVVEAVAGWFREKGKRWRPRVLTNEAPESAVAVGAAYYGQVRRGGGVRVSGGSARAYYVGVQAGAPAREGQVRAVCVLPRGTEEGTTLDLAGREFTVLANRAVTFALYSSTTRHDAHGDVVTLSEDEVHRHAPLVTVLRYGKRSRQVELEAGLSASFTEVGTLELWCRSRKTEHQWRLQFQLRGSEPEVEPEPESPDEPQTVIPEEATAQAARLARAVFGGPRDQIAGESVAPESLTGRLEAALGYGKDAWPMLAIRKLADVLAEVAEGRKKSARHEARWLNLFGFCLRPGFGAPADDFRVSQARKVYMSGLAFPRDLQCQVEWLVLWRRIAGGLNANQQQELYQRMRVPLGLTGKTLTGRLNTQFEREGWRLLASLEHLAPTARVTLGQELLARIKGEPGNQSFLWSLGRIGARIPLYGPLNCIIPAETAAEWIRALLQLPRLAPDVASAVVQLGARTNDDLRDIEQGLRWEAMVKLNEAGMADQLIEGLREYTPPGRADAVRIFGESLPQGLRLIG